HSGEFVTRNLAQTHYMLGAHDAVIATLDDHFEKFEANADNAVALLWRGHSHQQLGDLEKGLRDYKAAFALGISNDDFAAEYVKALIASERAGEAAEFLDGYAAANDTLEVHALQALTGYAVG